MRNIFAPAVETKLFTLFHSRQEAAVIPQTLLEMGHTQPPTPVKT